MRKTQILVVLSLLILWSACAFAYHGPLARPCYGDPDEFQAHRYHDEAGTGVTILGCTRGDRRTCGATKGRERRETKHERRYLSINFAGRTFFLER
jgi:hypothetical protein